MCQAFGDKAYNAVLYLNKSKDPGPEGPALVHPGGMIWMVAFISSFKVSGFGCQVSVTAFDPLCRSRS